MEDDLKRAWLAHYGAPLYGESTLSGRAAPELERLVVDALGLSRRDPSMTRALPVLLWRRRGDLDMAKLVRLAHSKGRERTLGFFLDLTARLSGDRRLRSAAAALRPSSPRPSTNFFRNRQGAARAGPRRPEHAVRGPRLGLPHEHGHGRVRKHVRESEGHRA